MNNSWESPEVEVTKAMKDWLRKNEVHSFENSLSFRYSLMLLDRPTITSSLLFET